jgi:hypothetical protein
MCYHIETNCDLDAFLGAPSLMRDTIIWTGRAGDSRSLLGNYASPTLVPGPVRTLLPTISLLPGYSGSSRALTFAHKEQTQPEGFQGISSHPHTTT